MLPDPKQRGPRIPKGVPDAFDPRPPGPAQVRISPNTPSQPSGDPESKPPPDDSKPPPDEPGLEGTFLDWIMPSEDDIPFLLLMPLLGPISGVIARRLGPAATAVFAAIVKALEGHHVIPKVFGGPEEFYRLAEWLHKSLHRLLNEELGKLGLPASEYGKEYFWRHFIQEEGVRAKIVKALRETYIQFDAQHGTELLKRLEEILKAGKYPH